MSMNSSFGKSTSSTSLRGKRKKKLPKNANPLFTQWLSEWREEAAAKGWKSEYNYSKALKTLKLFPLRLETGKDCKLLQNFGDKICKMLDEKLVEYKRNQASSSRSEDSTVVCSDNENTVHQMNDTRFHIGKGGPVHVDRATTDALKIPLHKQNASTSKQSHQAMNSTAANMDKVAIGGTVRIHDISDNSDSDVESLPKSQPEKRRGNREYVPTYRSGAYALVVTLFRYMQDPDSRGYMSKSELSHTAQPLSDKSFTVPDPGTWYTAWSSMSILIKKGYVIKTHSPARYSLTDAGNQLGQRLERADSIDWSKDPENDESRVAQSEVSSISRLSHQKEKRIENSRERVRRKNCLPAYRTPPYAILLALHRYMQDPDYIGYMTKAELCLAAQPFCDKSFTLSDPGRTNTAWTSMSALVKKAFVTKTNKPARYSLTDAGYQLAERLDRAETEEFINSSQKNESRCDSSNSSPLQDGPRLFPDRVSPPSPSSSPLPHLEHILTETNPQAIIYSRKSEAESLNPVSISPTPCSEKDESVFIVSDDNADVNEDDDVNITGESWPSPKISRRLHSLSPSPLSSSSVLPLLELHKATCSSEWTNLKAVSGSTSSYPEIVNDVMEISDEEDCDNCVIDAKITKPVLRRLDSDDSDELPDLDNVLPLSKRLLQKGIVNSDLLNNVQVEKNLTNKQCSDPLPKGQIDSVAIDIPVRREEKLSSDVCETGRSYAVSHASVSSEVEKMSSCVPIITSVTSFLRASPSSCNSSSKSPDTDVVIDVENDTSKDKTVHIRPIDSVLKSAGSDSLQQKPISSASAQSDLLPEPIFTLHPGTFDVVLCIDNREFYGSISKAKNGDRYVDHSISLCHHTMFETCSLCGILGKVIQEEKFAKYINQINKSNSKTLLPELMKSGVDCDLRLLNVGDLLWIARERLTPEPGSMDRVRGRELVLNYIIERKRMDDLVSSITSGRLKEQKFRLKHCGLSELILLIEEYGSIQNFSLSEDRIKQSIVNSEIIDGFKVKRCGSANAAVTYLTFMTRFLQQQFRNKTLHGVSLEAIRDKCDHAKFRDKEQYLVVFDEFNEASMKQKNLSVKEMFAKQLIQVPGISAERARAITEVYPTITALLDAYKGCSSDKARESLLAGIKYGKNQRNLGIAISRLLALLYSSQGSLS